jgi:cytochrome P450
MMEAVLILAAIAKRFRLELVPGQKLRLVPSITIRPRDGIKMTVRPRAASVSPTPRTPTAEPAQLAEA